MGQLDIVLSNTWTFRNSAVKPFDNLKKHCQTIGQVDKALSKYLYNLKKHCPTIGHFSDSFWQFSNMFCCIVWAHFVQWKIICPVSRIPKIPMFCTPLPWWLCISVLVYFQISSLNESFNLLDSSVVLTNSPRVTQPLLNKSPLYLTITVSHDCEQANYRKNSSRRAVQNKTVSNNYGYEWHIEIKNHLSGTQPALFTR